MLLIGHRGARAYEPENTLRSFKRGIRLGANAVEFDIRFSKDKIPVVMHDETLERTTNGNGNVSHYALKQLRKLDAGKGEKIPTLKEALMFCKKSKVTPVVELKEKHYVKQVIDVIKATKTNPVIVSYNASALREVKTISKFETGLIFKNKIKNLLGFVRLNKAIKTGWLFSRVDVTDRSLIAIAHKWRFKILVYVCNTKAEINKFKKLGVDGIASDKPDLFSRQFLNQFNIHRSAPRLR